MDRRPDAFPSTARVTVVGLDEYQPDRSGSEFDREIAVRALEDDRGTFGADLGVGWQIGAGINGGLLLALAGNALRHTFAADGHHDPITISAYYLSASQPGSATLRTEAARRGRSMSTGSVSLFQRAEDGSPVERLRALATFGDLSAAPDDVHTTATPPDLPPVEDCVSSDLAPASFRTESTLLERLDLRLDPDTVGWALGEPSGRGEIRGWLRLADGREPDALLLLLAVDALPPVTFDLGLGGWTRRSS